MKAYFVTLALRRWWQQLVERFFDIHVNMAKTGLWYFLAGDAKNAHCAICALWQYYVSDPITAKTQNVVTMYLEFHSGKGYLLASPRILAVNLSISPSDLILAPSALRLSRKRESLILTCPNVENRWGNTCQKYIRVICIQRWIPLMLISTFILFWVGLPKQPKNHIHGFMVISLFTTLNVSVC